MNKCENIQYTSHEKQYKTAARKDLKMQVLPGSGSLRTDFRLKICLGLEYRRAAQNR